MTGGRVIEAAIAAARDGGAAGLDLRGNRLAELPPWIGGLTALTRLDVNGNRIATWPTGFRTAPRRPRLAAAAETRSVRVT